MLMVRVKDTSLHRVEYCAADAPGARGMGRSV